jgi:cytochrome c-type biogenesis protein CcmH
MIAFLITAGALVAVALLIVLPPLLRRTQAPARTIDGRSANVAIYREHLAAIDADLAAGKLSEQDAARARQEIERRVLEDVAQAAAAESAAGARSDRASKRTAIAIAVALPLFAIPMYLLVGDPNGIAPPPSAMSPEQTKALVAQLAQRMEREPDRLEGWVLLARSAASIGDFELSLRAYARAAQLEPNDAQLLTDYADVLALTQNRNLQGEPEKLIRRALAIDPQQPKALALAGSAAYQRNDFKAAIDYWQRLLQLLPPDAPIAGTVQDSIADAQRQLGGAPVARSEAPGSAQPPAAQGARVAGRVQLGAALKSRVAADDTLFVYARAAEGPRMPLAILRKRAGDLPLDFALDDALAMNPSFKLSSVERVVIVARVSKSGNAVAQPGDLEGSTGPVTLGSADVVVDINRVLP